MKVIFKLTQGQQLVATAIAATKKDEYLEVQKDFVENGQRQHESVAQTGNLTCLYDSGWGVQDQVLDFGSKVGTLTYEGGRTALVDGCNRSLDILSKIAGYTSVTEGRADAFSRLVVVSYETTDSSLRWWETTAETLTRRSDEELKGFIRKNPGRGWLAGAARDELVTRFIRTHGIHPTRLTTETTVNPRKAAAGYSSVAIKEARFLAFLF